MPNFFLFFFWNHSVGLYLFQAKSQSELKLLVQACFLISEYAFISIGMQIRA